MKLVRQSSGRIQVWTHRWTFKPEAKVIRMHRLRPGHCALRMHSRVQYPSGSRASQYRPLGQTLSSLHVCPTNRLCIMNSVLGSVELSGISLSVFVSVGASFVLEGYVGHPLHNHRPTHRPPRDMSRQRMEVTSPRFRWQS